MASQEINLPVTIRTESGTNAARRLRAAGQVPAVVYGRGSETVSLQVEAATLEPLLDAPHIITLQFDGADSRFAVVSDVQRHFLNGSVLHVDFHEVKMGEEMHTTVPIVGEGDAAGESEGGVLEQVIYEIEISCLPQDLPSEITVDVSALEIGDHISLTDLTLPEGVTLRSEADESQAVFTVNPPYVEEEEPEEEELTEPELIGEKKEDDEEESDDSE